MKKYIYLLAFLMISHQLFAQTKKVYVTKSGSYTANSDKAVSYLLVQQLNGDSAYMARQYNMNNSLMVKGTYKDASLTIPNGKFVYYTANETGSYVSAVGYFVSGKRTGNWSEFAPNGQAILEYSYENNVLNGAYKTYDANSGIRGEGNMVNGKLTGDFKWYNSDGLLIAGALLEKGKIVKKTEYMKDAKERMNLYAYVEQKLKKYSSVLYDSQFTVKYDISKDGKITNPQIVSGYTPEINAAILDALSNLNAYRPATYNNAAIGQKTSETFSIYNTMSMASNYRLNRPIRICNISPPAHNFNSTTSM
jgi:antitoxin component YwqK of YwqJK toxin-antitoxin module